MKIKKFNQFNNINENVINTGVTGLVSHDKGKKVHTNPNRTTQYFYDYYTGKRITGKSKYELNREVFDMAQRNDEVGILAQFMLQVERESMASDYNIQKSEEK
jgi:hypothetical protein